MSNVKLKIIFHETHFDIIIGLFCCIISLQAQDICETCDKNGVFLVSEKSAVYKTGMSDLINDLNREAKLSKKVNGKVFIEAIITKDNEICCITPMKVSGGVSNLLSDNEREIIIKTLRNLQNWQAGRQRDSAINSRVNLIFTIQRGKFIAKS